MKSIYGDSEVLIGKWFKRTGKRDEIFVTSKFGFLMEGVHLKGVDTSAEYCKQACAKSMERLGVDYIDLCKPVISTILWLIDRLCTSSQAQHSR
jgi:aryl-alcohol dehydrogenase-like predicted oxidoreductase